MKKCNACNEVKELSNFKDGSCKPCYNKRRRERYANGDSVRILKAKNLRRKNNPEAELLRTAKHRAKRKNIPLDITLEDIIIPEYCPVLGIKLFNGTNVACYNSPTIDRIKPELGYVKGNIQVLSYRANMLKSNATIEELEKVLEHLKKMV
jgi:hypothetical protein